MSELNIYQRMSAITAELNAVAKNLSVSTGKSSYKAVGEADVLAAVKPLEAKHGVYSYPVSRDIVDSDTITTSKTYNGNTTETTKFFMRLGVMYRFVNVDKPDEYIDIPTYGDGIDAGDKAPGKAMTYADKYALLKAYKVITGEDPDQYASEEGKTTRSKTQQKTTAPLCEVCGKPITPVKFGNGQTWGVQQVVDYAKSVTHKCMCYECLDKAVREGKK